MTGFQHFYDPEGEYVSIESLIDWVRDPKHRMLDSRACPILIWGATGVGKTAQIKGYCQQRGLELRTYHPAHDVNGADIVGESYRDDDGRTHYALPTWLPTDEDPPGILFIDEINRAPEIVLAGLMEPIGEGTIAQSGWKIPDGWSIIAAANPTETGFEVHELDEAMVARMIHYAPGWDAPGWVAWASKTGIDDAVIDFVVRNPETIRVGETQLPHELVEKLRANARSVEYFARLFEPGMPAGLRRVISEGLWGREASELFIKQQDEQPRYRPLRFEELVRGTFEHKLDEWKEAGINEKLVHGTNTRLIAHLVGAGLPVSENVREERTAQQAGYYLAAIDPYLREEAMTQIERSAPAWSEIVKEAVKTVQVFQAKRGMIAGRPGTARNPRR